MASFLPVNTLFSHVYLVDLSPSLCEVARQRFTRLGWKNVSVVCQDAREFRLPRSTHNETSVSLDAKADLITMSYSLSMIPGKKRSRVTISNKLTDNARLLLRG